MTKFFEVSFETDDTVTADTLHEMLCNAVHSPEDEPGRHAHTRNAVVDVIHPVPQEGAPSIMGSTILRLFFEGGKSIRLNGWPKGDYIIADGAEGGTIWYYSAENDAFTPDYKLGFHELCGTWEVLE